MTTLRVIVEEVLSPVPTGISRYSDDLTRALIATAPPGTKVEGVVSASTEAEYEDLLDRFRGITLFKSTLARRELIAGWQHGFTRLPGMIHAPSLLAPLSKHDRIHAHGQQTVVTLHDVTAWLDPDSIETRGAGWHIAMAKRAHRYADALVVPTHAVADQLTEFLDFGDRVRVIGGAVGTTLAVPADADVRATKLALPNDYLVTFGGEAQRRGLEPLLAALALKNTGSIPLYVIGMDDDKLKAASRAAGLRAGRVRSLGRLRDSDLSVVLDRATALILPSQLEGFGLTMLEAFHFGTPVIHSDTPALIETAGDAGYVVKLDGKDFAEGLAHAIEKVSTDTALASTLSTAGRDRAGLFNWETSAEKVWQLHADL
jgi:glycosyltransferase involved in cell wall biosynthesis